MTSVLSAEVSSSGARTPSDDGLQLTMEKRAGGGHGVFQTFALVRRNKTSGNRGMRMKTAELEQQDQLLNTLSRSPTPDPLVARCLYIFGPFTWTPDSRAIHGTWLDAVPGRIGHSRVLDLAVEYALDSFAQYKDKSFSAQKACLVSRSKALKALREGIANIQGRPRYDIMLATKLHGMAEIFIEGGTLGYATHCVGLSEQLRLGPAPDLDDYSQWGLVDHTYLYEVIDAILTGRPSVFDSPKYLEQCHRVSEPSDGGRTGLEYQDQSRMMMHCMVRIPRLSCWVRRASEVRDDTEAQSQALRLGKSLWDLIPTAMMGEVVEATTTKMAVPPSHDVQNIIPDSFGFVSVLALVTCTRFWALQIYTSSLLQTLWREFPDDCAAAGLPSLESLCKVDVDAARCIIQSLPFTLLSSRYLPIVPLRMLGPLSLSVGSWYRLAQRLKAQKAWLDPASPEFPGVCKELEDAVRMEDCTVEQCNLIHESWKVGRVPKSRFEMIIPVMAGGEMPEWMPNKVDWGQAMQRMVKQGVLH